jgi:hypothetical protein
LVGVDETRIALAVKQQLTTEAPSVDDEVLTKRAC